MSHSLSSSETNSSIKASTNIVTDAAKNEIKSSQCSISLVQECSAIKKGLLWEQQQNKFFFNRWKERFFILTTDYLTCFKKGSKKVGMSEMGSFVYKINLNEIKTLTWVDKKKNGVIGVQLANTAIFLWNNTERLLDEWMVMLQESTNRTKGRREALRKSATLLPTLMTSSPSHFSQTEFNLIERNNSPNLFMTRTDSPSDHEFMANIVPPPPPPRRYLRCLSTDIDKLSSSVDDKRMLTTSSVRNKADTTKRSQSSQPSINNTFHKLSSDYGMRKLSSASSPSASVSQSLRCKSSYAIQLSPLLLNNSPTLLHQHQQRRATAKRLSAAIHQTTQPRPQSQTVFQSADSEFAFIPSKSISIRSNLDSLRMSTQPKPTSHHQNNNLNGSLRTNITSSASLMLNPRQKVMNGDRDRKSLNASPPPIPPHRTHWHHF